MDGRMKQAVKEVVDENSDRKIRKAVEDIVDDLCDRRGLGNEWDMLDDDVKDEIMKKWRELIKDRLT